MICMDREIEEQLKEIWRLLKKVNLWSETVRSTIPELWVSGYGEGQW